MEYSFHDGTLESFTRIGDELSLNFELPGEDQLKITICLKGVTVMFREGIEINTFEMESDDAEVLTLEFFDNKLKLILEWTDFKNRSNIISTYMISFSSYTIIKKG